MRAAFGLLESLVALIVFSVVILVCSQTLFTLQADLKILKENQRKQNMLFNAMLYLQNQLRYALISKVSSEEIEYFEIHRDFFFSTDFDPYVQTCPSDRIKKIQDASFIAFFSPSLQIAQVIKEDKQSMMLDRQVECGAMIPFKSKRKIFLGSNQTLYLDAYPLIEGLKQFSIKQRGEELEIKLCFDFCLVDLLSQSEIFYAF